MLSSIMPHGQAIARPLVSFIVASYNYERFIAQTIRSILAQTVPDFEIVVLDDASSDTSREIVNSFADPRIRLHVNEQNIGLVRTYNKAATLTRGQYISYLDSDDWIEPQKLAHQLAYFRRHPETDIVASYVNFVDDAGNRHPRADEIEAVINQAHDLNAVDTWVCSNRVVTTSLLFTRQVYERAGPRDETMQTASDFDLWARANALGHRFGIVQLPLLNYRLHDASAGQREPLTNFLEISYLQFKTVLPALEAKSALHLLPQLVGWCVNEAQFGSLDEAQQCRLLGLMVGRPPCTSCIEFKKAVLDGSDPALLSDGRRVLAMYRSHPVEEALARDIAWRDDEITARDRAIAWRDNEIAARDRQIAAMDERLAARDRDMIWRIEEIASRDRTIAWYNSEIGVRDRLIDGFRQQVEALQKKRGQPNTTDRDAPE